MGSWVRVARPSAAAAASEDIGEEVLDIVRETCHVLSVGDRGFADALTALRGTCVSW